MLNQKNEGIRNRSYCHSINGKPSSIVEPEGWAYVDTEGSSPSEVRRLEGRSSKPHESLVHPYVSSGHRACWRNERNSGTKKQVVASAFNLNNKLQAQSWGIMPWSDIKVSRVKLKGAMHNKKGIDEMLENERTARGM